MAFVGYGNDNGTLRKIAMGTFIGDTSSTTKITLGFKPKKLVYYGNWGTNQKDLIQYDEDLSTTTCLGGFRTTSVGFDAYTIGASSNNILNSIDNDGFTIRPVSSTFSGKTFSYFAIG